MKWAIPTSEGVISDYKCSAVTWKPRDNVMRCKKWLGHPTEGQCFKASIEDSQFNWDSLSCTFDYPCDITCSWSTSGRSKNRRQSATIFHPSIHPSSATYQLQGCTGAGAYAIWKTFKNSGRACLSTNNNVVCYLDNYTNHCNTLVLSRKDGQNK